MVTIDELIASETLDRVGKKLDEKDKEMMYLAITKMIQDYTEKPVTRKDIDRYLARNTTEYNTSEERLLALIQYNVDNITK